MITPIAFADSVAFSAGQEYENRRIGEILRNRLSLVRSSHLPPRTRTILLDEIEATIRAIEQSGSN